MSQILVHMNTKQKHSDVKRCKKSMFAAALSPIRDPVSNNGIGAVVERAKSLKFVIVQ